MSGPLEFYEGFYNACGKNPQPPETNWELVGIGATVVGVLILAVVGAFTLVAGIYHLIAN